MLVAIPMTAFYVDDATGVIWGPDPNGTVVSPLGIKLAPQTPASTGVDSTTGDHTATYTAPTAAVVKAATVPPPATPATPPAPSSSSSFFGIPRTYVYVGAAAVAALLLFPPGPSRAR
jgi:hypothetical protein